MHALIVNPTAGSGRGINTLPEIENLLVREGIEYRVFKTACPKDATRLAKEACNNHFDAVVSVGGDGTLLETASGMMHSGVPLLIVPCGTGNDFIRTLQLPRDPVECLKAQLHAPIFPVDAGRMNDHYFLNVSGTGLDVEVLKCTEKYKSRFKGLIPYLLGVVDAVKSYKPAAAKLLLEDGSVEEITFSVLSVGNAQYFGGGMRPVPHAVVNDGLFDVVITRPVKRWQILFLMVLFVPGKHLNAGMCREFRCKKLSLINGGMTMNLDGELYACDRADYELIPGAIMLKIPAPK